MAASRRASLLLAAKQPRIGTLTWAPPPAGSKRHDSTPPARR
jgi:hypothetical protein